VDAAVQLVIDELFAIKYRDLPETEVVLQRSTVAVLPVRYMPAPPTLDTVQLIILVFEAFCVRIPCDEEPESCCTITKFLIVILFLPLLFMPTPAPVIPQSILCPLPSNTMSFAATENPAVFANIFPVNTYVVPAEFKL
jgi:hypothetical protein